MTGGNTGLRDCVIPASLNSHPKISLVTTKESPGGCKLAISFRASLINRRGINKHTVLTQGHLCWVFFMLSGKLPTLCQLTGVLAAGKSSFLQAAAATVNSEKKRPSVVEARGCSVASCRSPAGSLAHAWGTLSPCKGSLCLLLVPLFAGAAGEHKDLERKAGQKGKCCCRNPKVIRGWCVSAKAFLLEGPDFCRRILSERVWYSTLK